ncbi:class I SAM-dependent methyltransferase [Streptomyces sp. 549]|uniref:SAM-dependent methyltransferase n=1 Tax=Streptomyces sp. 549 TaxID=3049076 RepID=UPI0024C3581B|nr:class I SAM-dependent methyltransferase [Streptomyces sp. 549]MDK1476475.1 class I SAM-dependent methyltransferase [Streptomyces sp. 549]
MDRRRLSALAHTGRPIAAPLDDATVNALLARALPTGSGRLLDLGCGEAAWLSRALAGHPDLLADGVDSDTGTIGRARAAAERDGLTGRLALHAVPAADFTAPHRYDLVLSIGASHAFGGLLPTLDAARAHLAPGGQVLVGEGFWERPPGENTLRGGFTADEFASLADTVDAVSASGWTPVHGHVSTPAEWDAYEWHWVGTLAAWALDHPGDPDSAAAARFARTHRDTWLHGYRGELGFTTLLLRPTPG